MPKSIPVLVAMFKKCLSYSWLQLSPHCNSNDRSFLLFRYIQICTRTFGKHWVHWGCSSSKQRCWSLTCFINIGWSNEDMKPGLSTEAINYALWCKVNEKSDWSVTRRLLEVQVRAQIKECIEVEGVGACVRAYALHIIFIYLLLQVLSHYRLPGPCCIFQESWWTESH